MKSGPVVDVLLLTALSFLILFAGLYHKDLWNSDEATVAQVAREMLASQDFLVPRMAGQVVYWYPPLMYWLICAVSFIGGGVTTFTATLPSVLAATGCVLLVYRLGADLGGRPAGLLAGFFLLLLNGFVAAARLCRGDMAMVFFELLAMSQFLRWYQYPDRDSRPFPWLVFYFSLALAWLAKGPQGVIVPCGIIFLFLACRREWKLLMALRPWWGLAVLVATLAPWYLYVQLQTGFDFLMRENLDVLARNRPRPIWEYPVIFVLRTFPWVLFLGPMILVFSKESKTLGMLLAIWVLFMLVFYSIPATKRYYYVTFMHPAAALALAAFWRSEARRSLAAWWTHVPLLCSAVGSLIGVIFLPQIADRVKGVELHPYLATLRLGGVVIVAIFAMSAFCAWKRKDRAVIATLAGMVLAVHFIYSFAVNPGIVDPEVAKGAEIAQRSRQLMGPDREMYFFAYTPPHLAFYLDRPGTQVNDFDSVDRLMAGGKPFAMWMLELDVRRNQSRMGVFDVRLVESLPFNIQNRAPVYLVTWPRQLTN